MAIRIMNFTKAHHIQPGLDGGCCGQMGDATGVLVGPRIVNLHQSAPPQKPRSPQRGAF